MTRILSSFACACALIGVSLLLITHHISLEDLVAFALIGVAIIIPVVAIQDYEDERSAERREQAQNIRAEKGDR